MSPIHDGLMKAEKGNRLWSPDQDRLIFTDSSPERFAMEQLRRLRARLYQLRAKSPIQTILVSSALDGDGKTFISANLALALAKQGSKKVLLVDADLRKPALHELFGAPGEPGLTEHLAGTAELNEIIQGGPIENLWLLPAGAPTANAAELLGNKRLADLLESLARIFDWIILDSSPVLQVCDGVIISRCCDAVLLVARAESTPYDMVQQAQQEFREARVLGLVLNCAGAQVHAAYRHSDYYYGAANRPENSING
jgi:capsular exopolysaccharide synthesis family protein